MSKRLYVGVNLNSREIFWSGTSPLASTHGDRYIYVIGPFRTKAGAEFMRDYGDRNPHCRCVSDAERLARKYCLMS